MVRANHAPARGGGGQAVQREVGNGAGQLWPEPKIIILATD